MTVFSAPDYPQFIPEAAQRYRNRAAVAVLSGPGWAEPDMRVYEAAAPRPEAAPFYNLLVYDSDEDWEPAASDASGMTGVVRDAPCEAGEPSVAGGGSGGGGPDAEGAMLDDAATAAATPEQVCGAAEPGSGDRQQRWQQLAEAVGAEAAVPVAAEDVAGAAAAGTPMDLAQDSTTTSGNKENAAQRGSRGGMAAPKAELEPAEQQQQQQYEGGATSPVRRAKRVAVRMAA